VALPARRAAADQEGEGVDVNNEQDALTEFIRQEIGYAGELSPDKDLLEAQILDSFNIVQLAAFVQQRFEIELEAEDLVRTNLATLASIAALVRRKKAAA
jgi:acyl carrier protein